MVDSNEAHALAQLSLLYFLHGVHTYILILMRCDRVEVRALQSVYGFIAGYEVAPHRPML